VNAVKEPGRPLWYDLRRLSFRHLFSTSLTVFGHSYLTAVLENVTNRALGKAPRANVLPERNEKAVYLNPVLAGQVLLQFPPRRVGR